jgi:hypothetical protein
MYALVRSPGSSAGTLRAEGSFFVGCVRVRDDDDVDVVRAREVDLGTAMRSTVLAGAFRGLFPCRVFPPP